MAIVAPNLASLIGETVGARLISHAGSLTNLAKAPASTVQILGAEKALFRALKTIGNTPKYGLIFHSSFIGRAGAKNKGRISLYLANKCSIASRIDSFSEESTTVFGKKLKEQVEDRLKFYETGDLPRKNVEVMAEALEEAAKDIKKKKKEKKKKRKLDEEEISLDSTENMDTTAEQSAMETSQIAEDEPPKKKKKKNKAKDKLEESVDDSIVESANTTAEASMLDTTADDEGVKKKKKKKNKVQDEESVLETTIDTSMAAEENGEGKKKKKKKDKVKDDDTEKLLEEAVPIVNGSEKKKKKNKVEVD